MRERINNQIKAPEVRVISNEGDNLGVLSVKEALAKAESLGLDLIEISPNAKPPIVKIADYGKYKYDQNKKQKKTKAGTKLTETKSIQIKIGTGENDLALKARKASKWLGEGHRIKIELFLSGRSKYMQESFLKDRLDRVLHLITENFKIAEDFKKGPKGPIITIEKDKS
ncbi:MAG TPA: translation initiation factor IF-3 [Candidatus Paceibacterota bacterium]|nr:translation initiation factor IF-3 [Candidatus Paceibacterota bacterium]HOX91056.1 translation initiation factor IF-3 [Candidatus Paceibacterota bacterium]HPC12632.1 translation initiation factor IF-3 [Candidatus Paceibacterota bacterium]HPI66556.1 translation initiation factor IF-3 [Candidatus Paceibacterota bacterium]HQC46048.1 translation initiation factor IF-3 [Candidatus Paceibacterota bacterium]